MAKTTNTTNIKDQWSRWYDPEAAEAKKRMDTAMLSTRPLAFSEKAMPIEERDSKTPWLLDDRQGAVLDLIYQRGRGSLDDQDFLAQVCQIEHDLWPDRVLDPTRTDRIRNVLNHLFNHGHVKRARKPGNHYKYYPAEMPDLVIRTIEYNWDHGNNRPGDSGVK